MNFSKVSQVAILVVEEGLVFALGQPAPPLRHGLCSINLQPLVSDHSADIQCVNQLHCMKSHNCESKKDHLYI